MSLRDIVPPTARGAALVWAFGGLIKAQSTPKSAVITAWIRQI